MPERPVADAPTEHPDMLPPADLDRSAHDVADAALRRQAERAICDAVARYCHPYLSATDDATTEGQHGR